MNRIEYTRLMIDSMRRHTSVPFDHYVIDNGSSDETPDYLMSNRNLFAGVELSPANLGIDGGTQRALEAIGNDYDFIVKVDNDCEFIQGDWLAGLIEVAEAYDRRIVLSPYVEGLSTFDGGYPRDSYADSVGRTVGLTKHVGGLCIMAPAAAYEDFSFGGRALHGGMDVAFSIHVRLRRGYEMGYVEDVRVRHMDTTVGQLGKYPGYFQEREETQRTLVHGEPALITGALRPIRRLRDLHLKRKAGLLDVPVLTHILGRAKARVVK